MYRLLLLAVAISLPASAAAQSWMFETIFPSADDFREGPDDTDFEIRTSNGSYDGHGVAVDPDGKVWFQYYFATDSVQVAEFTADDPAGRNGFRDVRVTYVFNADGSEADISPIKFVEFPGGDRDTLGGFLRRDANNDRVWEGNSNRGLRADPTGTSLGGDVLISSFNFLYRVDYETGQGVAVRRFTDYCAATQAASDNFDNVYIASVCPGAPVRSLAGSDFSDQGNVRDESIGFARGVEVSPDGLTVYEPRYTSTYTVLHTRDSEFGEFDSTGVAFRGMRTESITHHPITGNVWASSGSFWSGVVPNQDPTVSTNWEEVTWYEFTPAEAAANEVPTPISTLQWNDINVEGDGTNAPRPRGLAFSPDGQTAYVAQFGDPESDSGAAQKFRATSTPNTETGVVPGVATLQPNTPNPASGATAIRFTLDKATHARVRLYDATGREVMTVLDESLAAGEYAREVTVADLPAGVYVYSLEVDGRTTSRRMLVVR